MTSVNTARIVMVTAQTAPEAWEAHMSTKSCYVLTIANSDGVELKRPTTSRTTLLNITFQCLGHVQPKTPLPWTITLESCDLSDVEFKALKTAFTAQMEAMLHSKLTSATPTDESFDAFLAGLSEDDDDHGDDTMDDDGLSDDDEKA